jgi:proteasome lid subunit RPN8/RPN11
MISNEAIERIKYAALSTPDQEICGYVLHGKVFPGVNVSHEPEKRFELDAFKTDEVYNLIDKMQRPIIYHSHITPGDDDWSIDDIKLAKNWGLPMFLYHTPTGKFRFYDPLAIQSYLGREWHWLTSNCYTLIQDIYLEKFGVSLKNVYLRTHDDWNSPDWRGFVDNLEDCGFYRITEDPKFGDMVVMQIGRTISPNHCSLIWNVEENQIIHHLLNRLSAIDNYDTSFRKATYGIYRHVSQSGKSDPKGGSR